jgi:hypothetical protein
MRFEETDDVGNWPSAHEQFASDALRGVGDVSLGRLRG